LKTVVSEPEKSDHKCQLVYFGKNIYRLEGVFNLSVVGKLFYLKERKTFEH